LIKTFIGAVINSCNITGWIPKKLVLSTGKDKQYRMIFTIQTYDIDNKLCYLDCMCEGEVANAIYNQYNQYDVITVWGQLKHTYMPHSDYKRTTIRVKVLDFTLPVDFKIGMHEPILNEETDSMLNFVTNKAFEYYNEKQSHPTEEDIKYWVDYWEKWRNKNDIKK